MFGNREKDGLGIPPMTPPIRNTSTGSRQAPRDTITAYLGPDTEVEGTLRFQHSVLIEGRFKGEIHSEGSLVIGEGAEVDAEITSRSITVKGTVHGSMNASERVQIQSNGCVLGDITTPSLQMDESVTFEGRCSMGNADHKSKQKPREESKKEEQKILDAVESVRS
jgi:cytoskeletal protein CcmA (bactofilin family)